MACRARERLRGSLVKGQSIVSGELSEMPEAVFVGDRLDQGLVGIRFQETGMNPAEPMCLEIGGGADSGEVLEGVS
jgi:hypothetical protein